MLQRWPTENVGILTRLSGVTVVDVDDPALVDDMVARFGVTPLNTRTPSGGTHLWYRRSDDADHNLRGSEGLAVDLRSSGVIVVPPSQRSSGKYAGRCYEFIQGSWDDLTRLPKVRPGSLPASRAPVGKGYRLRAVREGWRNETLFRQLLRHARHCDDKSALQDVATTINEDFYPPLALAEVTKTVKSAWTHQLTGRNWVGTEAKVQLNAFEIGLLITHEDGSDAALLYLKLWLANWDRHIFAVSAKAMVRDQVIPGWAHGRYRRAVHALVEIGLLVVVHQGGSGTGDPRLFTFAWPVAEGPDQPIGRVLDSDPI